MNEARAIFEASADLHVRMCRSDLPNHVAQAAERMAAVLSGGGTIYWVGNGGSAADAQHLAAELVGRFVLERPPLRSHALTVNTSALTALVNDGDPTEVYARQVRAFLTQGDALVCLSTSGRSANILRAAQVGRERGAWVLGLCGESGPLVDQVDRAICVPATDTARIQEGHILIGHTLCALIERTLFP